MRIIQAEFTSVEVKSHSNKKELTLIEFFSAPLDLVTVLNKTELIDLKNKIEIRLKELRETK